MTKPNIVFTIRRIADGLYSRGGTHPKWGKSPKTWGQGPFKNHLQLFAPSWYRFKYHENKSSGGYGPEDFRYRLIRHNFPYWDCEAIEMDVDSLERLATHPLPEWTWNNVYAPTVVKETRYTEAVKDFCAKYGIEFP